MKYTLILATLLSFLIAGCNTMHGVGQDVSEGGEAIQKAAD
ncbi:MAG: entericidin A/B family lipoprotein [Gammaproteobacteria bacterium]